MIMKPIFCLLLLAATTSLPGQEKQDLTGVFSIEELKQDFGVFRDALEEGHPGLYRYSTKENMDSIFAKAAASLTTPMKDMEFMLVVSRVAAQVGDGHLKVSPPKLHKDKLDQGQTAAPFRVYWDGGKLFVYKNYSTLADSELLGAQIISINGHPTADIIRDYLPITASDGSNLTNKYRMLSRPRPFARCLNYLYGHTDSYQLEYLPANGTGMINSTLPAITFDELFRLDNERYPETAAAPLAELSIAPDNQYAYLRIATFDNEQLKSRKIDFKKFLDASFRSIEASHVDNLILDLRGNGGGTDEFGKSLFSYFTDHPFDYYKSLTMNRESFDFFKYTSMPNVKAPKGMLKANSEGTFDNIQHANIGKQSPSSPTYSGNIFVLIDGGCFSTAGECISMLHCHTNAIFIGEESGGGYYGNCSGPSPEFKLPNTKIGIEMPL
ncbi:MAG: S41 family peptidase, partial [Pirellulaceae bacterium]